MNNQDIKTTLINVIGETPTAYIQALRFVYILLAKQKADPETALLSAFLHKGDTAIDVGANGADWTTHLHRAVGDNGAVFAFEADPYYALATGIAVKLMGLKGVRLFPFGLSDSNEEVTLRVTDADGSRLAGLSHIEKGGVKNGRGLKTIQLKPLDSLVREFPALASAGVIKCDVEGYELFVFRGAVEILKQARPVVILEIGNFEEQGYTAKDVVEFFDTRDYRMYAMTAPNTLALTNAALEHAGAISVNRIMIPKEKIDALRTTINFL